MSKLNNSNKMRWVSLVGVARAQHPRCYKVIFTAPPSHSPPGPVWTLLILSLWASTCGYEEFWNTPTDSNNKKSGGGEIFIHFAGAHRFNHVTFIIWLFFSGLVFWYFWPLASADWRVPDVLLSMEKQLRYQDGSFEKVKIIWTQRYLSPFHTVPVLLLFDFHFNSFRFHK